MGKWVIVFILNNTKRCKLDGKHMGTTHDCSEDNKPMCWSVFFLTHVYCISYWGSVPELSVGTKRGYAILMVPRAPQMLEFSDQETNVRLGGEKIIVAATLATSISG